MHGTYLSVSLLALETAAPGLAVRLATSGSRHIRHEKPWIGEVSSWLKIGRSRRRRMYTARNVGQPAREGVKDWSRPFQ